MSKIFVDLFLHVFYTFAIKMWCYNKKYRKIENFKKFFQFGLNDSFFICCTYFTTFVPLGSQTFCANQNEKVLPCKVDLECQLYREGLSYMTAPSIMVL